MMIFLKRLIARIKAGLPHVQRKKPRHLGDFWCWRLYGLKPYYRLCLFDYTAIPFGEMSPAKGWHQAGVERRVDILGVRVTWKH